MSHTVKTVFNILAFSLVLLAMPGPAQDKDTSLAAPSSCGDSATRFQMKFHKGKNPPQIETGKALVYLIVDETSYDAFPYPINRAGLDGKWVGATWGNSYLYFSVDPGVHHLCSTLDQFNKTATTSFIAEAGDIYYFEAKNTFIWGPANPCCGPGSPVYHPFTAISLAPVNNGEGQHLTKKYKLSVSQQMK